MVAHVLESMNEVITNNYDEEHKAIDIVPSNRAETNIIALESGIVDTVEKNIKGTNYKSKGLQTYGNYIKIKQNDGKTALYAHMKYGSITVNEGQYVEKGAVIGTIGNTGKAFGTHLHLEIQNENNIKENPIISLNKVTSKTNEINVQNNDLNKKTYTTPNKDLNTAFLKANNYHHGSIVDALKSIGSNSSYNYRKKLAQKNGIENYKGSYSQNIQMLNLLKEGKLKKA